MSDLVRNYPVIFLPLQNNVEQSFGKDDNELKRIYTILNSLRGMYYGGTPPTSPNVGDKWHDSSTNIVKQWNGSTWAVFLESTSQLTGVLNEALGAPIASASTINLTTATGNFLHVTGTTTITAVTLGAGMRREIIFDGILTLTHHATNNNLPGGANITTAVGDRASYYSDGTTVYCTKYEKADGRSLITESKTSVQGTFKNLKITNNAVIAFTGNTTSASTNVVSVSSTVGLVVGMQIFGVGIQTGTTISAIGSGTITLSTTATATATGVSLKAGYCNTQTVITADQIILLNTVNSSHLATNVNLIADLTVSGASGLDTGTKTANTWYSIWIIAKEDGTKASLLSLSETSPTIPIDYVYKARVGWTRTDSSSNLLRLLQRDKRVQYVVTTSSNTPKLPLMASGALGSPNATPPTWVAIAVDSFVPPTATRITPLISIPNGGTSTYAICAPNNNYGNITSATNPAPIIVYQYNVGTAVSSADLVLETTNIYYASSTSTYLYCLSWEE